MGRKFNINIGDKLKKLTVKSFVKSEIVGIRSRVLCDCECGKEVCILPESFRLGKHCPCEKHLYNDLTGKTFGKMKVNRLTSRSIHNKSSKTGRRKKLGHLYECSCIKCGRTQQYYTAVLSRKGFKGCRCRDDFNGPCKHSAFRHYQHNASTRNIEFNLSFDEFVEMAEKKCFYCNSEPSNLLKAKDLLGTWKYNGIDRINNEPYYSLENSVPCCSLCNRMKWVSNFETFKSQIIKIYNHLNLSSFNDFNGNFM